MAGIGVKLKQIYSKNTLTTDMAGIGYSVVITIAPMISVIITMYVMQYVLEFSSVEYAQRDLFTSTVMYIFIFSLITTAPFNSVLSRYMSDTIFRETFEDVRPC